MRCCARSLRAKVVAGASGCARDCSPDGPAPQPEPAARAPSRVPWAELLSRVFKVDVLKCENCGGRMTVLEFLTERAVVKKILEHLGLPATGPPKAHARGPRSSSWMSDRLTSCGTSCQTTTREGALARLWYGFGRRPAAAAAARRGLALYQLDMACVAPGKEGS